MNVHKANVILQSAARTNTGSKGWDSVTDVVAAQVHEKAEPLPDFQYFPQL